MTLKEASEKAGIVVDEIIGDIQGRSGFGNAWDDTDEDVRTEIRDAWVCIVTEILFA